MIFKSKKNSEDNQAVKVENVTFLMNRAWGFHIVLNIIRLIATGISQNSWQIALKQIRDLKENEEDGVNATIKYD